MFRFLVWELATQVSLFDENPRIQELLLLLSRFIRVRLCATP